MKRHLLGLLDARNNILSTLLTQSRQWHKLLHRKRVYVSNIAHKSLSDKQFDSLFAERLYLHRLARNKVNYTSNNLRWATLRIWAVVFSLALDTHKRGTALWAVGDILKRYALRTSLGEFNARNLGDNLATLLHIDHIAKSDIEQGNLFSIMERCTLNCCTCQMHRLQIGNGSNSTRATHLKVY